MPAATDGKRMELPMPEARSNFTWNVEGHGKLAWVWSVLTCASSRKLYLPGGYSRLAYRIGPILSGRSPTQGYN